MENELKNLQKRIETIKKRIASMDAMRPGSLTRQKRGESGTYYQLSYTHRGKGRTEYIREEFAEEIRRQIKNYKKFRELTDELIDLEIERSKIRMKVEKKKGH